MLAEGVSIIREEQWDWDGQYIIGPGRTYCFEFFLKPNDPDYVYPDDHHHYEKHPGHCHPHKHRHQFHPGSPGSYWWIEAVHDKPTAQDLSLQCWFSLKPNGQQFFPCVDNMDIFPLVRQARTILIGAEGTKSRWHMPVNTPNYLMVKNLQNSENIFKLSFLEHLVGA